MFVDQHFSTWKLKFSKWKKIRPLPFPIRRTFQFLYRSIVAARYQTDVQNCHEMKKSEKHRHKLFQSRAHLPLLAPTFEVEVEKQRKHIQLHDSRTDILMVIYENSHSPSLPLFPDIYSNFQSIRITLKNMKQFQQPFSAYINAYFGNGM